MLVYHAVTASARMQSLNEAHSALRFIWMQTLAGRPSGQSVLKKRTPRLWLCVKFWECCVCKGRGTRLGYFHVYMSPYISQILQVANVIALPLTLIKRRNSQHHSSFFFQLLFSTWGIDTINWCVSGGFFVSYSPYIILLSELLHVTREFLSVACQENEGVLPVRILCIIGTRWSSRWVSIM